MRMPPFSSTRTIGLLGSLSTLLLTLPIPALAQSSLSDRGFLDRTTNGMVTSAHPIASQVGLEILRQGGNAADAAVATTLAISVVEPFSAGIGGGGFLLLREAKTGQIEALDFRERAPLKATPTMYLDAAGKVRTQASKIGALAIGVPGTIAGLVELHRRYGKLPWKTLVKPAIELAETGFPVSRQFLRSSQWGQTALQHNPEAQRIFTKQGKPLEIGDRVIQTDLARTLRIIAQEPQSFYRGALAQAIVRDITQQRGILSLQDLQQYRAIWRSPVCGAFEQYQVCSMPPSSSGGVLLLEMLNLLSVSPQTPVSGIAQLKQWGWHDPRSLHRLVEVMRLAYRDRAEYLGDPDFVAVPVQGLINPLYAQVRQRAILPDRALPSAQVPLVDPWAFQSSPRPASLVKALGKESSETSHLTIVDRDRNAVSLTFTINLAFGSGVVAGGTGIVLNNEMDDFAVAPNTPNAFGLVGNRANAIAPGKTPLSSMTPTIVTENGNLRLAVGAPGGSTIITTVLQVLLNHLVYGMDLRQAIAAPRIHHQWQPDALLVEPFGLDPLTQRDLTQRGYQLKEREPWGNANGIAVLSDGSLEGAADPRGEGSAVGW